MSMSLGLSGVGKQMEWRKTSASAIGPKTPYWRWCWIDNQSIIQSSCSSAVFGFFRSVKCHLLNLLSYRKYEVIYWNSRGKVPLFFEGFAISYGTKCIGNRCMSISWIFSVKFLRFQSFWPHFEKLGSFRANSRYLKNLFSTFVSKNQSLPHHVGQIKANLHFQGILTEKFHLHDHSLSRNGHKCFENQNFPFLQHWKV